MAIASGCNSNPGRTKQEMLAYVLEQAYTNHEFIGNVLVADSGQILFKESYGKADAEKDIKNIDSTKFLIASILAIGQSQAVH